MVSGLVSVDEPFIEFGPAWAVASPLTADRPSGPLFLVVTDRQDRELWRVRFDPIYSSGDPAEGGGPVPEPKALLNVVVPIFEDAGRVTVEYEGSDYGHQDFSAHAPEIEVAVPEPSEPGSLSLTWEASDADGDPLTFLVMVSANGGATWSPVTVDWPEQSIEVRRSDVPIGPELLVRVVASDGLHSAMAISPPYDM
jgi:hypothetical protein